MNNDVYSGRIVLLNILVTMNFPMLILTVFSQTVSILNLSFFFGGTFGISIVRPDFFIQKVFLHYLYQIIQYETLI